MLRCFGSRPPGRGTAARVVDGPAMSKADREVPKKIIGLTLQSAASMPFLIVTAKR